MSATRLEQGASRSRLPSTRILAWYKFRSPCAFIDRRFEHEVPRDTIHCFLIHVEIMDLCLIGLQVLLEKIFCFIA